MPPLRTGVADYALDLLTALRRRGKVEVDAERADINLYQIGNNQLHAGMYRRAIEQPGVVVLHDAVLHHFALGFFSREQYIDEFAYNYGEWARDLGRQLWDSRARSGADPRYFQYPMLRRIVERSHAVIVHNPAAAGIIRKHCPGANIVEIPHLFAPQPPAPPGSNLCGVFGYLRESKRIRSVIEACERVRMPLLLAGASSPDLERAIAPYLSRPWITRIGHTPTAEFRNLRRSVGVCINLRYPSAGETSGIGVNMMGIGKPVIFTESAEVSRYPAEVCVRIDPGLREPEQLEEVLLWWKLRPSDAREIGARAAAYIRAEHGPERVAELYWNVLRAALDKAAD